MMDKKLFGLLIFVLAANAALHDDFNAYNFQGSIDLVDNIQNFGYSPNQLNLVVLTTDATNTFIFYEGLRLNTQKTITIADDGLFNVKPSTFAFSKDSKWLLIGTTYGAVYAYQINNGKIENNYKLKSHIATTEASFGVSSISISANGVIAVAAKNKLVILTVPTDPQATDFVKKEWEMPGKLSAVAWKYQSEQIVIVGGKDDPAVFHTVDVTTGVATAIEATLEKTNAIGVFPDETDGTILQGRTQKQIQIFKWDEGTSKYLPAGIIAESINAGQISISSNGLYFAAEIPSTNKVMTWKSGLTVNSGNNLQNQPLKAISPSGLTGIAGKNLALASDGNRILVVGSNKTAVKYNLCEQGKFYQGETCKACPQSCGSCFNEQNCQGCTDNKEYIDDANVCQPCSGVTDGCETCTDADTCSTCNTADHWKTLPENGECKCVPTYFKQEDACSPCSVIDHCDECSSATNCEKCKPEGNINPQSKDGKCVCLDGWYFDAQLKCQDCTETQKGCKQCASETICTLCDDANHWVDDKNGKCICKQQFWRKDDACVSCTTIDPFCSTCSQDGKCLDCSGNRELNQTTGTCECKDHTYEDQTTKECKPCDTQGQCLECQPTEPHTCTLCDNITQHRRPNPNPQTGKCECQKGFTEDADNLCIACNVVGCEDCNNVEEQCTTCFQEKNFDPTPTDDKKCVCKANYHLDTVTEACFTCDYKNPGCTTCENLDKCQACDGQANFQPTPNAQTNQCDCKSTFFKDNKACKSCSGEYTKCETCNAQACLTCQANHYPTDDKKKCLTCSEAMSGCNKCDSVHKCSECDTESHWQLNDETHKCHCQSGYLEKEKQCKACSSLYGEHCSQCNDKKCTVCQETFSYNEESNVCFCPDDKEIKDGKCEDKSGLSAIAIIGIIVGILALAGGAVAIIKCFKKRQSPLEDGEYEALEGQREK